MAVMNCQSIFSKKAFFDNFISDHSPNIIAGCESWLTQFLHKKFFQRDIQCTYRKDRSDGYGGVFVACGNNFVSEKLILDTNAERVACRVDQNESQPLFVCSLYRPPNNDLLWMKTLCDTLADIASSYSNSPIWIAGDINLPNFNRERNYISRNAYAAALCNFFKLYRRLWVYSNS